MSGQTWFESCPYHLLTVDFGAVLNCHVTSIFQAEYWEYEILSRGLITGFGELMQVHCISLRFCQIKQLNEFRLSL